MNEIKFRAWDTTDNTMWAPWNPYITQFQAFEIADRLCSGRFLRKEEEHNYIFSQYTWLKDMNWKEIFEGDIVNIAKDNWISNKKLEVKWDKWGFFPLTLYALECEIIGNIYENPNLLENE